MIEITTDITISEKRLLLLFLSAIGSTTTTILSVVETPFSISAREYYDYYYR